MIKKTQIVFIVLLAACSGTVTPQPTAVIITPVTTEILPTLNPPTATASVIPTPSPSPESVYPFACGLMDIAFIDPSHGWALGYWGNAMTRGQIAVCATSDGGRSWEATHAPETEVGSNLPVTHIRFADSKNGWVFNPELFSTHDGGQTWIKESPKGEIVSVEPSDGTAWAVEDDCLQGSECKDVLLVWTKTQQTWVRVPKPLPTRVSQILPIDAKEAWMVSEPEVDSNKYIRNRIFLTQDGGLSWEERTPSNADCKLATDRRNSKLWLACGGSAATDMQAKEVYVSTDKARHWIKVADATIPSIVGINNLPLVGIISDIAAVSDQRAFIAFCRGSVIGTMDGGHTWRDLTGSADDMGGFGRVLFVDELHGWALPGQNWVLRTDDGGLSWKELTVP